MFKKLSQAREKFPSYIFFLEKMKKYRYDTNKKNGNRFALHNDAQLKNM
jgi:hypothetical protein